MTPMPDHRDGENRIPDEEARRLCEVIFGETMGCTS
jgi:hypothetical protein